MKKTNVFAITVALLGSLTLVNQAVADPPETNAVITTFDYFASDALYTTWDTATINSTATSYVITSIGYGSNWKYIGGSPINGTGCTNIQLDVYLSGPAAADGKLGPIVELLDGNGNDYSYCWYGQTLGHHILNMPIESPTIKSGTGPLNLSNLQHMHIKLDPGAFGTSGAYTISWNDLRLTGGITDSCAQNITTFADFILDATWGNFAGASVVTNTQGYQLTTSGWGGGYKGLPASMDASGNTNLQLTVNFSSGDTNASGKMGAIVQLVDNHGNGLNYSWYGNTLGEHVLNLPLSAGVWAVSNTPSFNFSAIVGFQLQADPYTFAGTYTVAWENLELTGCAATAPIVITAQSYDPSSGNFTLAWSSAAGKTYSVLTSTNLAGGFITNTTGISSGGTSTTNSVTLTGPAGFVRVQQN